MVMRTILLTILITTGAQGILEFAYDYDFCNCPDLPENLELKSSTINMNDLAKAKGLDITAEPNFSNCSGL